MPGSGGHRFEWVGKPPFYWSILAVGFFISMAFHFFDSFFLQRLAARNPDAGHSHSVMVDGGVRYVWSWLGWFYDKAEWISAGLFAALILIMILKRNQVRKVR